MAYDEYLADRIRGVLKERKVTYCELKMMGGLCIMVGEKMCCGILYNKKHASDLLMARIGPDKYENALKRPGCQPMDFTGRPMNGYVFITPEGFDMDKDLAYWMDLCLAFNPVAKSSKKKKKA
jgi:hypothetical protein